MRIETPDFSTLARLEEAALGAKLEAVRALFRFDRSAIRQFDRALPGAKSGTSTHGRSSVSRSGARYRGRVNSAAKSVGTHSRFRRRLCTRRSGRVQCGRLRAEDGGCVAPPRCAPAWCVRCRAWLIQDTPGESEHRTARRHVACALRARAWVGCVQDGSAAWSDKVSAISE